MDIILRQVRIKDGDPLQDVAVKDGNIVAVTPAFDGKAAREIQADGRVLLPGLIESHLHLEKALIMERKANRSGTLQEAIAVSAELKPTFTREDILDRARKALRMMVGYGSTCVRAHSEFDPAQGFTGVDAVLELKKEFRDIIDIQITAFPQEGIHKAPGTEEMMHEAIRRGCDVVGGIPYNDTNAEEHIDLVFRIARQYDMDLDFHQDFSDNADKMSIQYLAEKTIESKYEGRVSVGHLTSLGAVPPEQLKDIAALIRDAGINVMCLPMTDLHLGARNDTHNVRRALTPVRTLRDGGVNVCLASNNIRNAFTPFGNGDLFQVAMLAIPACHLGGADDQATVLPMITTNAAKSLKLKNYGLAEGNAADLVLIDTKKVTEAVIDMPDRLFVIKRGKIVVESQRTVQYAF